jgi:hypothetical protein
MIPHLQVMECLIRDRPDVIDLTGEKFNESGAKDTTYVVSRTPFPYDALSRHVFAWISHTTLITDICDREPLIGPSNTTSKVRDLLFVATPATSIPVPVKPSAVVASPSVIKTASALVQSPAADLSSSFVAKSIISAPMPVKASAFGGSSSFSRPANSTLASVVSPAVVEGGMDHHGKYDADPGKIKKNARWVTEPIEPPYLFIPEPLASMFMKFGVEDVSADPWDTISTGAST